VKFTEHGEIAWRSPYVRNAGVAMLQFEVKDAPVSGRPRTERTSVQHLNRQDVSTTRKFGGTGLGLSISKAGRHDGRYISVESCAVSAVALSHPPKYYKKH